MDPSTFQQKLSYWMILCDATPTTGIKTLEYEPGRGGPTDGEIRLLMYEECQLEAKDNQVPPARQNFITYPNPLQGKYTYGELFIKMCARDHLRATDEGTHFRVQPRH